MKSLTLLKSLLLALPLLTSTAFAGKDISRTSDGFTVEKYYRLDGNGCLLVAESYKNTSEGIVNKPMTQERVDIQNCYATFKKQKDICMSFDRMGNEMGKVDAAHCSPGAAQKDGWFIVTDKLQGSLQITLQKGPLLFTGGKPPVVWLNEQGFEHECRVTLFERDTANRRLNPRIIRLNDIQVRIDGDTAQYSFNSYQEKAVDGQRLEPVQNITCVIKNGTKLPNGQTLDLSNVESFKIGTLQEIAKMFSMPISKKPPTDI